MLAIAFVSCTFTKNYNPGAVLEWIIAFIFSAYVFSFYVDLYPAAATKQQAQFTSKGFTRGRHGHSGRDWHGAGGDMEMGSSEGTLSSHDHVPRVFPNNF